MNDGLDMPHMFDLMWNHSLKTTDRRAVCATRGFKTKNTTHKEYFSAEGIFGRLIALSDSERALLWLLAARRHPVDLRFFNFFYDDDTIYLSEAKRKKIIQSRLKERFVQNGVLATYEDDGHVDLSGNETYHFNGATRYYFPDEFAAAMSLPFQPVTLPAGHDAGVNDSFLMNSVRTVDLRSGPDNEFGDLHVKKTPYTPGAIRKCQEAACIELVGKGFSEWIEKRTKGSVIDLADNVLSRLKTDQWAPSDAFRFLQDLPQPPKPFTISSLPSSAHKPFDFNNICAYLWTTAHLEKARHNGADFYRLREPRLHGQSFASYLSTYDSETLHVNLLQTPFAVLDSLERLFLFKKVDNGLLAKPDVSRISNVQPPLLDTPLSDWLKTAVPAFDKIMRDRSRKFGKFLVHTNVMLAKIEDLSLKVALDKEFGQTGKWLSLDDRHAAFCISLSDEVQSSVRKAKHVVKEVAI